MIPYGVGIFLFFTKVSHTAEREKTYERFFESLKYIDVGRRYINKWTFKKPLVWAVTKNKVSDMFVWRKDEVMSELLNRSFSLGQILGAVCGRFDGMGRYAIMAELCWNLGMTERSEIVKAICDSQPYSLNEQCEGLGRLSIYAGEVNHDHLLLQQLVQDVRWDLFQTITALRRAGWSYERTKSTLTRSGLAQRYDDRFWETYLQRLFDLKSTDVTVE